jgi:glycosyltransferase involved in cell wall biosynthesis
MTFARVSVVMIFFDAEPFLEEAIESVLAQTFQAWELLLVDDGSTDGSARIARQYAEKYPTRLRYVQHHDGQNHGMSAARNLGLQHAVGEYVAFLDADDVWLPQKLERQVAILDEREDAMMVFGPTEWWYSWTGDPTRKRDFINDLGFRPDELIQPPSVLRKFLVKEDVAPCTCSVLVRRQAVDAVGGFEDAFRGMYEDQAFFAKVCVRFPVFASRECLARYRRHRRSSCSIAARRTERAASRLRFLAWLNEHLRTGGIQDEGLQHIIEVERAGVEEEVRTGVRPAEQNARPTRVFMARLRRLAGRWRKGWKTLPVVRSLRCMEFRRLEPLRGGRQTGTAIVRHYWAEFLNEHRNDLQGRALEIGTIATLRRYGGSAITRADALDLTAHGPDVTQVADLSRADHLLGDTYDCFVNQFTMHVIYDVDAALYHSVRLLKPGGVLLVNFPCVDYYFRNGLDMGTGAPLFMYWWFTPIQVENLLRRLGLTESDYQLRIYGNLFTRIAYQLNVPAEELTTSELTFADPGHPLLICARVVKPRGWNASPPKYHMPWLPSAPPARWNPTTGHYG